MADDIVNTGPAAEAAPADAAVSVAVEPTSSNEISSTETVTPDSTPDATKEAPKEPTTVLGALPEEKPVEVPQDSPSEETPGEGSPSEEPAPLPTYEPFELPENVKLDESQLGEFTSLLGEFERETKADHAEMQKLGQTLIERHVAEVQDTVQRLNQYYSDTWEKQKNDWKDSFVNDPEIGGNRQETTVNAALQFIRTHGGTEEQQVEFRNLMETTGIGNHPAMIRLLAKANMAMSEGRPIPAIRPAPAVKSKVKNMYGG